MWTLGFTLVKGPLSDEVFGFPYSLANIGSISGLPQDQVFREALNTVSKSTGFSVHPEIINHQG